MVELQEYLWCSLLQPSVLAYMKSIVSCFLVYCIKCYLVIIDSGLWIVRIESTSPSIYREENSLTLQKQVKSLYFTCLIANIVSQHPLG